MQNKKNNKSIEITFCPYCYFQYVWVNNPFIFVISLVSKKAQVHLCSSPKTLSSVFLNFYMKELPYFHTTPNNFFSIIWRFSWKRCNIFSLGKYDIILISVKSCSKSLPKKCPVFSHGCLENLDMNETELIEISVLMWVYVNNYIIMKSFIITKSIVKAMCLKCVLSHQFFSFLLKFIESHK